MKPRYTCGITGALVALILAWTAGHGAAEILNVPSDHGSIQEAIWAASEGDTVLVEPGTYQENLSFSGPTITVEAVAGASQTVIDGGQQGPVVVFDYNNSTLRGFTLTNGSGSSSPFIRGGGVVIIWAAPVIENCVITDNDGEQGGGVATIGGGTFRACKIVGNRAQYEGGGIFAPAFGDAPVLVSTLVARNRCGRGAGILGTVVLRNCSILNNEQGQGISQADGSTIVNSIIYGNELGQIDTPSVSVTYSNVQGGYDGEGNLDAEPLFEPSDEDYHLSTGSPCIDQGTPVDAVTIDLDGQVRPFGAGLDIGADEFVPVEEPPAENQPPVVETTGPYKGKAGVPVAFDACDSYDPDGDDIVLFEWDWDGDGVYDEEGEDCTASHVWDTAFDGAIGLRISDDREATAETTVSVKVTASCGLQTQCAVLGDNKGRWRPDVDTFRFIGQKGERVTIQFKADGWAGWRGKRVMLVLQDRIRRTHFLRKGCGAFPNCITAVLPKTGSYEVSVMEYSKWRRWGRQERFAGSYCLMLKSSKDAWTTLQPTEQVE